MALITCKYCGKSISDTTNKCIHCGGEVKTNPTLENNVTNEDAKFASTHATPETKNSSNDKKVQFDKLGKNYQVDLEEEFMNSNKSLFKYRRKGIEIKKFGEIAMWLLLLPRVLLVIQSYVAKKFFNGVIYDQIWIERSYQFAIAIAFVWIVSLIMLFYSGISYRNKVKKIAYKKLFQKWLLEERQIVYYPNLTTNKEQQIFDNIDINTFRF